MKKLLGSLPARLVLGVLAGIFIGLWAGGEASGGLGETVMQVILTVKNLLGSLISFCVPLIVIGFIAPSITRLKSNASRMLGLSLVLAYTSSVCAALLSAGAGFVLIPGMSIQSSAEGLRTAPELLFQLEISPIMPVISALVFSVLIGLAATWTQAGTIIRLLEEFQHIVLEVVTRVIIPILPFFVGATFCELSYEGRLTVQFPIFLKVIGIVIVGHFIWLAVLYSIGGILSGRNPWRVLRYYLPAYLTAVGTMSSAATLPVALSCARRSPALSKTVTEFMIPLGATVHLCGSVLTETFFVMTISLMLYGTLPSVGTMAFFIVLFGIFAVGAPGVPGGTVMASLGLVTSVLHFDPAGVALLLAIFALQDSFGTACNVTGDGALAMMMEGIFNRNRQLDDRFGTGE
mgnify:CR=1 FL=1